METINDLTYELKINYINNNGVNVSMSTTVNDDGLEINSVKIGNVCITEETINGRVLSGRYDENNAFCGYKYNYEKNDAEYLVSINPEISINDAVTLINKVKMTPEYLSTRMVFSSILRDDYRVFAIKKGNLNIIKTISAENEKSEKCVYQEIIDLTKTDDTSGFVEVNKKQIYKIDDKCIIENGQQSNSKIKLKLKKLLEIIKQNPNNHKKLISAKEEFQQMPETLGSN